MERVPVLVNDIRGDFVKIVNDGEEYVLQNLSKFDIFLVASATKPTTTAGAIILPYKGNITSNSLSGNIWCKSTCKLVPTLSLHKK